MRVYFSHAIRGKAGSDASHDVQSVNCAVSRVMAGRINEMLNGDVDFYIPAEHEDFVQRAYDCGYIKESEILDIDCQIIDDCDAVVVFIPDGDCLQGGRKVEYDHCVKTGKPVCIFHRAHEAADWLKALVGVNSCGE